MLGRGHIGYRVHMSGSGHSELDRLRFELLAIVVSLGGTDTLPVVLGGLPETFPVPILLVQHRSGPHHQDWLTMVLQRRIDLPVRIAADGQPLACPGVSVVPGGCTATINPVRRVRITESDPRTAGDTMLASGAAVLGPAVIGVVLTGRLHDGAQGVRAIKDHGGRVLAQDPATARAPSMPASAIATGCVDFVLPPQRIPAALITLAMAPGRADLFHVPTPRRQPSARSNLRASPI